MDKIRVGVAGVGHLGRLHASLYKEVKDAYLAGIFDADKEKSAAISKELGVKAFDSYDQLLENVDALNIVTPTSTHFDLAKKAILAGKHVFIEKPITRSTNEAQQLIDLAAEANTLIQVGHIERFNPAMLALQDVQLEPIFVESHRLASFDPRGTDVAVILDLMIHDLDLILHMVKSPPKKIAASGVGVVSSTVDIANARIEFENGCVANVTASRISNKKMRKMRLFQKDAYISVDFVEGFSEIFYIPQEGDTPFKDGTLAFSLGKINEGENAREIKYNRLERKNVNPLLKELTMFVDAIRNNLEPPVTAQDGMAALKLANLVLKEIQAHQDYIDRHKNE